MFKTFFQSLKKSKRLQNVSRKLSEQLDINDIFSMVTQVNKEDEYLEELFDIAESDEYVKIVMNEYQASRQTLKILYKKLASYGAGQYAGGHYVAASSLVYPLTLRFLLKHFDGKKFSIKGWDDNNSTMFIAHRLIEYFKKGKIGEISY